LGGRGLFASRDIKRGELAHWGAKSDVMFPTANVWRQYIFSLPRAHACDMANWCWHQEDKEGDLHIFCSMNIAILMNEGRRKTKRNVGPKTADDYESKFYALRDIQKDEEILMDYGTYETDWKKVGLGW